MRLRFTNSAILALISILTLTGVYGLFWTLNGWLFEVHRGAAWALMAFIPWKIAISWKSLKRGLGPRFDRGVMIGISVVMAVAALTILTLGLLWAWRVGPKVLWLNIETIAWHWIIALALIPPFALHVWRRWPKPKLSELTTRRSLLKGLGFAGIGLVGWGAAEVVARARSTPDAPRRYTGSRGNGFLTGNQFPVTGEWANPLDIERWALDVHGAVAASQRLTYSDVLALPSFEFEATLDCTNGWYSQQVWRGISLIGLLGDLGLRDDAHFIRLKAATGYAATFSLDDAKEILLATHVGGWPLDHWHGYPVRAVAPSWRGWYWVKWVTDIEVRELPQADLPGIINPS